ncbi:MAG: DUF1413 domain-containing protein [Ruminococcus sp.]|nr:DUF1413 domain-containing protein [Ruminococcus sp.]
MSENNSSQSLEIYLNKALKNAEKVEYGQPFSMKELLDDDDLKKIGSSINELGKRFKDAIDLHQAKNVSFVKKTPQNACVYVRKSKKD